MASIEEFNELLAVSINNPRFPEVREKMISIARELRDSSEVSQEGYMNLLGKIDSKFGRVRVDMGKSFKWFNSIMKSGWGTLKFTEKDMDDLLVTREACSEFYSWAEIKRHRPNNAFLINHVFTLAQNLVNSIQAGEERRWDDYSKLKSTLSVLTSRSLVEPKKLEVPTKVVCLLMGEEELTSMKVKIGLGKLQLATMNFFGETSSDSVDEVLKSWSDIFTNLFYLFVLDGIKYRSVRFSYRDVLNEQKASLRPDVYQVIKDRLDVFTMYLEGTAVVPEYAPIKDYYYDAKSGEFVSSLLYNEHQILTAMDLSRRFFRSIPDSFLIEELLIRPLRVDISQFGDKETAKKDYSKHMKTYLEMLRLRDIISSEDYLTLAELGREKFGE